MTRFRITPLKRAVENLDWTITPERQARSEAYHQQMLVLHRQFESEWIPPPGYCRERDLEEMENIKSAAFTVWEERRKDRTVAASTPVWMDHLEYWLIDGPSFEQSGPLARQPTPASLTLPFILKGGGDMQVTFETRKVVDGVFGAEQYTQIEKKHRLVVRTEHGVYVGWLERECGERSWYVVSLTPLTPQVVADRIAATLDAINELSLPDDYLIVMPVSDRCSMCARPLTDIVSKTLGLGPDCAAKLKIPHSAAVADAIIVKRRAFLGDIRTAADL